MSKIKNLLKLLSIALVTLVSACTSLQTASESIATKQTAKPTSEVVSVSEVKWSPLNPLRGDKSPKAGTLWGAPDRKLPVATGFLVQFADSFSSPPHIHNITYRGVVISGLVHNDDPDAAEMWMPAGSFWTQPAGEVHITAAKGPTNMAYIEIDQGPYLVLPSKEAFDLGERPINVHASNIVWVDQPGIPAVTSGPKVAFLWGQAHDGQLSGTLVKLPAGFSGKINSHGSDFRAIIIQGQPQYHGPDTKTLDPGSYFGSKGESVHRISSKAGEESIIYVRTDGKYEVLPAN